MLSVLQSAPPAGGTPVRDRAGERRFRPEVQGLRAVAVAMVVVYHVWLGRVSGGVDVFLLVSAFLLTLTFTQRLESGKPPALVGYWLGLLRRLLPAAVVVLLAVLAATAAYLPSSRWRSVFDQTWASLTYRQNWELAGNAVDYYALDDSAASPLQHFWSLSVQGQVFLLWPLLFAACAVLVRRSALRPRPVLLAVFGTIFVLSLAFSIWQTGTDQAAAYFDTRARLWEFALGSLVALVLPYLRLPMRARILLGWTGVAMMLACGLLLQVQQQFPGYIALWPTLAAAAVIVAGRTGSRAGVDRWLSSAPCLQLGGASYALYLWHWPVLVIWLIVAEKPTAGLLDGAVVIAASLVLAVLTTRLIEAPVASWSWLSGRRRRTGLVLAGVLALVAVPLSGWEYRVQAQETAAEQQTSADNPGAAALSPGFRFSGSDDALVMPLASSLGGEWPAADGPCAEGLMPADPLLASCVQTGDPAAAERTVLLLGDSHSKMWMTAVGAMATGNNWLAVSVHRPSCRLVDAPGTVDAACSAFNRAAVAYALELAPDAVLTVGTRTDWSSPAEEVPEGFEEGIAPLLEAGIPVVGLRDTPRFEEDMAECTARHSGGVEACDVPAGELLAPSSPLAAVAARVEGLEHMELTDLICSGEMCHGVIGNVRTYMDRDHLSRTYVATTTPVFEKRFRAALGW
ncbi:acyltransferase family protein [Arthrobacter agilis]|uniref:acyltransferase family protein n=1 Tax=Arthrobacter agilis TaxID=37921 RepID=UPI002365224D|nr:acyltransferase family protein [Arthrobacter agilis]WDF32548.1 acyltransferase family protein [Arthrobacter agilis]